MAKKNKTITMEEDISKKIKKLAHLLSLKYDSEKWDQSKVVEEGAKLMFEKYKDLLQGGK